MKKIAIFTMGTRGDVQPYLYLAKALQEAGVSVVLGTHPCWKGLAGEYGVPCAPVGPDIDIEYEAACIRGKTKNPMISMLKTMNFVFRIIQNSSGQIYDICSDKDIVIVSHSNMGAVEATMLGIPIVNVTLQTEMIPQEGKKVSAFNRLIGKIINGQMLKPYNKILKQYGHKKINNMDEISSKYLNLIPISRYVLPHNPYWAKKNKLVGYWYMEEKEYVLPKEIADFLQKGEPPVILALGAMSFESDTEIQKLEQFIHAFKRTGMRALIQGFVKSLTDYQLPETMMAIGSVPHSWLFRQGYCVIHHCGFGTASAAMIYGIPSIPVPHILDQFSFSNTLYSLGVSTQPVRSSELSEERIIQAISEMKQNYTKIKENVTSISEKIQSEHGLATAVELICSMEE